MLAYTRHPVVKSFAQVVSCRFLWSSCSKNTCDRIRGTPRSSFSTFGCGENTKISIWRVAAVPVLALSLLGGAAAAVTLGEDADRLERWKKRWQQGRITFHREQPNAILINHYDRFLGDPKKKKSKDGKPGEPESYHRVLVPLCGKTVDMPFLADKGHEVLGVDGVETAAWQLQRDGWLKFEVSNVYPQFEENTSTFFVPSPTFEGRHPGYVFKTDTQGTGYYLDIQPIKWFRDTGKGLSVVIQDFLQLSQSDVGTFDRIWDRGALVAIRPEDRPAYIDVCDRLLKPGGCILLATYYYDQSKMKGPPHSIPLSEVQQLYRKDGYKVELLSSDDVRDEYEGAKWNEVRNDGLHELAVLITKRPNPGWFGRVFLRRKMQ